MIAETISLGILSLPSVLATIGFVPGIILIIAMGALATYTGYVLGQYKAAYPRVHNLADALEVMWGPFGREFGGAARTIFLIFGTLQTTRFVKSAQNANMCSHGIAHLDFHHCHELNHREGDLQHRLGSCRLCRSLDPYSSENLEESVIFEHCV